MDFILLGHFALDPLSLAVAIAQSPWNRFLGGSEGKMKED
jgi:hypothetical protein